MIPVFACGLSAWKMSQQQTLCLGVESKAAPLMCTSVPGLSVQRASGSCDHGGFKQKEKKKRKKKEKYPLSSTELHYAALYLVNTDAERLTCVRSAFFPIVYVSDLWLFLLEQNLDVGSGAVITWRLSLSTFLSNSFSYATGARLVVINRKRRRRGGGGRVNIYKI